MRFGVIEGVNGTGEFDPLINPARTERSPSQILHDSS